MTLPSKRLNLAIDRSEPGNPEALEQRAREREQRADELIRTSLLKATGTDSAEVADRLLNQTVNAQVWPRPKTLDDHVIAAISTLEAVAPRTALEATLAVQMIAVHDSALRFLSQATAESQSFEGRDANVLRATRLMRIFNEQLEARQKLRGEARQQKMIVEHVHIHEGGQAIVGAVSVAKGQGKGDKDDAKTNTP